MDHLIEHIEAHIDFDFNIFYEEFKSGEHGHRYCDQPSYFTLKAQIDSVNILRSYMGWDRISIKELILEREERE